MHEYSSPKYRNFGCNLVYPQTKPFLEGGNDGGETTRIQDLKITDPFVFVKRICSREHLTYFTTRELCWQHFQVMSSLPRSHEGAQKTYQVQQKMNYKYFGNDFTVPCLSGWRWSPSCWLYRVSVFLSLPRGVGWICIEFVYHRRSHLWLLECTFITLHKKYFECGRNSQRVNNFSPNKLI